MILLMQSNQSLEEEKQCCTFFHLIPTFDPQQLINGHAEGMFMNDDLLFAFSQLYHHKTQATMKQFNKQQVQ